MKRAWLVIFGVVGFGLLRSRANTVEGRDPNDQYDNEGRDIITKPVNQVNVDNSLVPSFCPLRYAETAGTQNFNLHEFACKDAARTPVPKPLCGNVQILMEQLEVIRAYFGGRQVIIHSAYRTPQHNRAIGGVEDSQHKCATAVDFTVVGVNPKQVQITVERLMAEGRIILGGLGKYNTFTHYDIGPARTWIKR